MNRLLTALALLIALTTPALAQDMPQDIACSAFLTMSQDDQMAAMTEAMSADAMAAGDAMATDDPMAADAMANDDAMAAMVETCTANPDMMVMDAMHMMN
jgi:hypothetical protein